MYVFLSWSGNSRPVAAALNEWLSLVLHPIRPWMSTDDIDKGARTFIELDEALSRMSFGIICVTSQNATSTWLNYEAGALASDLSASRVSPFLVDLRPTDLTGPLANLQATEAEPHDMLRLLLTINRHLKSEDILPEERVRRSLAKWWPDLEAELADIRHEWAAATAAPPRRPVDDVLNDIFQTTKSIQRKVENLALNVESSERVTSRGHDRPDDLGLPRQEWSEPAEVSLKARRSSAEFEARLESCDELWMLGKSLAKVTSTYENLLLERVRRGLRLRFTLLDPLDDQLLSVVARSLYSISTSAELRDDILLSLRVIERLRAAELASEQVQVRLCTSNPEYALTLFVPRVGAPDVVAELYPFRVNAPRRPHLFISSSSPWSRFFGDQFEEIWERATRMPDEGGRG
jgi:hypothetical protein